MLYMVIEHFKNGDARPVYERFRDRGRMLPEGVEYVDSWTADDLTTCYQLMRADDVALLHEWAAQWNDVVDFEFIAVISGKEAAARILIPGPNPP